MYVLVAVLSFGLTDLATPRLYKTLAKCEHDKTVMMLTARLAKYECWRAKK